MDLKVKTRKTGALWLLLSHREVRPWILNIAVEHGRSNTAKRTGHAKKSILGAQDTGRSHVQGVSKSRIPNPKPVILKKGCSRGGLR